MPKAIQSLRDYEDSMRGGEVEAWWWCETCQKYQYPDEVDENHYCLECGTECV